MRCVVARLLSRALGSAQKQSSSSLILPTCSWGSSSGRISSVHGQFRLSSCFSSEKSFNSSTEDFKRAIESEMDRLRHHCNPEYLKDLVKGLPFQIIDDPSAYSVIINREFAGERMQIVVEKIDEEEYYPKTIKHVDDHGIFLFNISLLVNIHKENNSAVAFLCTCSPDVDFIIHTVVIKNLEDSVYHTLPFFKLRENMKTAFHSYLQERGLDDAFLNILHQYMVFRDDRDQLALMGKIKNSVNDPCARHIFSRGESF